ncbi:PLP-dependent transferase [Daedalea quercina L-15889]|uniref:PLP-dependent transferase n=1 Tax=Daedalea quercina L-15889 TaxID=1314783 RepID=A0A165N2I5_9APHY|nr:PLP-dependent transferase [Daedalea quercina L-15889]
MVVRDIFRLASVRRCGKQVVVVPRRTISGPAVTLPDVKAGKGTQNGSDANSTSSNGPRGLVSPIKYASRLVEGRALREDVWSVFTAVNLPPSCIHLGQGDMNFAPPDWAREGAEEALRSTKGNHYAHQKGLPRLRKAIQQYCGNRFHGRELDTESEILVTNGANEGEYATFTAFIEPGDEVIIFEPFYDAYLQGIIFNGGIPVYVPLHPSPGESGKLCKPAWTLDLDELRRSVTPRTKMIVLNTPHNPLGKVFTRTELEGIAELADKHNLLIMSDEVYEHLVYNGDHVRFASLPGMWERTITAGSAGKMFAGTGWRVGWVIGPPELILPVYATSMRIVLCANTPMQHAAAAGLEQADARGFFAKQREEYMERMAILSDAFERLGISYTRPEGGYFIMADIGNLRWPSDYPFPPNVQNRRRDFYASWFIAMEVGVSSIPVTDFYCDTSASIGENYLRFSFAKDLDTLRAAGERLQGLKKYLQ